MLRYENIMNEKGQPNRRDDHDLIMSFWCVIENYRSFNKKYGNVMKENKAKKQIFDHNLAASYP